MTEIGKAGRKSEALLAKRLGGRLTPNSGASGDKGDINRGDFTLEAKSTQAASYGVKYDELLKITREAARKGTLPGLAVTFTDAKGKPRPSGRWALMPEDLFRELMDLREEQE